MMLNPGIPINQQRSTEHLAVELEELERVLTRMPNQSVLNPKHADRLGNTTAADRKPSAVVLLWEAIKKVVCRQLNARHTRAWKAKAHQYLAACDKKEVLSLLGYKFLKTQCDSFLKNSKGLLLAPYGAELSPVFANKGQIQKQIAQLMGLERLVVARQSDSHEPKTRLIHAIKGITNLKYGSDFKIDISDSEFVPIVYIRDHAAARFIGGEGSNLYFIESAAGLEFDYQVIRASNGGQAGRKPTS